LIRWVFFDMGNVVMNDDPTMAFLYAELQRALSEAGHGMSFEELLREREEDIALRGPGHWYRIGEKYLGTDGLHALMHRCAAAIRGDYMRYHNLIPGMTETLELLARQFQLGILANQLRESIDVLASLGLKRHFPVLAVSELIDLKKPEPEIFAWALREAQCAPEEAIMVGDRIDNDVLPARRVGMWAIWFHAPLEEKGYVPVDATARLYFESQKRASISQIGPAGPEEEPDGDATSARELLDEILRLRELSRHGRPLGAPSGSPVPRT
jgi:HAD superfamily hydrolase (TIGR01509 family)